MLEFAKNYTAAWCSQEPYKVAAFYSKRGSLTINDGAPAFGTEAITEAARGFMDAFPDMVVSMDSLDKDGEHWVYSWRLQGANDGPGGTGNRVDIRGQERWLIGGDGLIAESSGRFDEQEYERQLAEGV